MCLVSSSVFADLSEGRFTILPDCKEILSGFGASCKRHKPITHETKKYFFSNKDFNWSCSSQILRFDFFNTSNMTVRTIVIEGATAKTRLSESVFVPPGQSEYVLSMSSGAFCRKEKSARLYFEYKETSGGECLEFYSNAEMQAVRAECEADAAIKEEQNIIYNNCVVEKSKGVEKSAMPNVRSVCREISKNPSTLQRWRWGD